MIMRRYLFVRLFQTILTLFILSAIIFLLVRVSGDPAVLMLPEEASQEDYQKLREKLGLDKPIYVQYSIFLGNAVTGDLGRSIRTKIPVSKSIRDALPNTLKLIAVSMFLGLIFGIPIGVLAAAKKNSFWDRFVRVIAGIGQSVPTFWMGLIMINIFVVKFNILPSSGMGSWKHYLMPSYCLAIFFMAAVIRLLRSSMLEILDAEFIKLARVKGLSEAIVIWKHTLKNSLLPVVSFSGVYIALLISGSIMVETVFAWPGFGRLAYRAIFQQDFPLIQGVVLTAAVIVMAANYLTDILYAYLDPRIRHNK